MTLIRLFALSGLAVAMFALRQPVFAADLNIKEVTRYYSISGSRAAEFAAAMTQRGPYSRQHGRRVWATAARSLSFQLVRKQSKGRCRLVKAKVFMDIKYSMPKLRNERSLSSRERSRWRKMYAILDRHERTHGRYYRQLAQETHRALSRMRPANSCRALDLKAKVLVKKLSADNKARNDRFDVRDKRNYRKMERLYAQL